MTNYVKYAIIILSPSLELVVGGNFMESNNAVSYEHLRSLDDEARRLIDEVLVPKFEQLSHTYPHAHHWDVCIAAYTHDTSNFYVLTFVAISLDFGAKNPKDVETQCNPYGEAFFNILPKVDQILNNEQQNYGIIVGDEFLKNEYMSMQIYSKFNSK